MAGIEEMLGQVLSNPQAMQQILSLAQSLNLGQAPAAQEPARDPPPPPPPQHPKAAGDSGQADGLIRTLLELAGQGKEDKKQLALFSALKPFLKPERAKQLDKAIRVARISAMAGAALQRMGPQAAPGGGHHV